MIDILIVEDNQHKLNKIKELALSVNENFSIDIARSFTSAWTKIRSKNFSLIFLDMSLPTFDSSESERGGRFRVFGGKELARKMTRKSITSKFVFITHYKNFSDNNRNYSFDEMKAELMRDYNKQCLEVIFYSNKSSEWRIQLSSLLLGVNQ